MRSGQADLPLHYGRVPIWLAQRMSLLGGAIVESVILEYGRNELLSRLSDPCWFQSLGCVLGMDWHSSGITTSVMGALKKAVNARSQELGVYICGGRGKYSLNTPEELRRIAEKTGLDGDSLVRHSRLTAKVDNVAVQDGFQLYLHAFVLSKEGEWTVIQQGMNTQSRFARRYHWHSPNIQSFVETPHSFIYGPNQGKIFNLTDIQAREAKKGLLELCRAHPDGVLKQIRRLTLPAHHDVRSKDVNLTKLGTVLTLAYERQLDHLEDLLLLEGMGPRAVQSLALVSEVIHGGPSRFEDPARFSFAHGGKDGHPFPVPTKIYDESIQFLQRAIDRAKLGYQDKSEALKNLHRVAEEREKDFVPHDRLEEWIQKEQRESWKYGGRTVFGKAVKAKKSIESPIQLRLF